MLPKNEGIIKCIAIKGDRRRVPEKKICKRKWRRWSVQHGEQRFGFRIGLLQEHVATCGHSPRRISQHQDWTKRGLASAPSRAISITRSEVDATNPRNKSMLLASPLYCDVIVKELWSAHSIHLGPSSWCQPMVSPQRLAHSFFIARRRRERESEFVIVDMALFHDHIYHLWSFAL